MDFGELAALCFANMDHIFQNYFLGTMALFSELGTQSQQFAPCIPIIVLMNFPMDFVLAKSKPMK